MWQVTDPKQISFQMKMIKNSSHQDTGEFYELFFISLQQFYPLSIGVLRKPGMAFSWVVSINMQMANQQKAT